MKTFSLLEYSLLQNEEEEGTSIQQEQDNPTKYSTFPQAATE